MEICMDGCCTPAERDLEWWWEVLYDVQRVAYGLSVLSLPQTLGK